MHRYRYNKRKTGTLYNVNIRKTLIIGMIKYLNAGDVDQISCMHWKSFTAFACPETYAELLAHKGASDRKLVWS